jgi:Tfp pilus assembly protein PilO
MVSTPSLKKLQIDQATRNMIIAASVASFITIFCVIAGHSLLTLLSYQNKVITARQKALNQLNVDVTATKQLTSSYNNFNNSSPNLLGSPITGNNGNNGNNAKIILDSLPSQYDFPALATSLQALLSNRGVTVVGIGGTDSSAGSSGSQSTSSSGPVAIPVTFTVSGPYQNVQNLISATQSSIRPIQIQTLSLSGDQNNITLSATAQTFYQPAVKFNISSETVAK